MKSRAAKRSSGGVELPSKRCVRCARVFEWRKKWARDWDQVRYCSDACRSGRGHPGGEWEAKILEMLEQRAPTSSICPSDVARATGKSDWRELMPLIREAAHRLATRQLLKVTQGDQAVDALEAHGPIRLRRP